MSMNKLEGKCRELRGLQRLIEEATAEAKAIKDAIKAHMGNSETAYAEPIRRSHRPESTPRP